MYVYIYIHIYVYVHISYDKYIFINIYYVFLPPARCLWLP